MTGSQILAAFESIGAVVKLTPAGIVDIDAPDVPEFERLVAEARANRSEVVAELRRHATPLIFDPDRLRRHEERAARAAAALAEMFCRECGFSLWRVTPRGDASCYACDLLREGKPLRCAACGREEWRRDEHGHAACASCAPGNTEVAAPPEIARPESTLCDVYENGGAE